ncbi:hypothetical protein DPMN_152573 [Dreissena polymorpha]|uniref:Uncharacterized protein n=1 Tax=Dreissena polymorpha TaxID=45954 RepID=A0A9D4FH25_DREPO|nr:hypothetical protein DPMN_152573 [Dreissena polymorpha]
MRQNKIFLLEKGVQTTISQQALPRYTNTSRERLTRQYFATDSYFKNNKSPNHLAPGVGSATKMKCGNLSGQPYSKLPSLVLNSSDGDAKVKMASDDVESVLKQL